MVSPNQWFRIVRTCEHIVPYLHTKARGSFIRKKGEVALAFFDIAYWFYGCLYS